MLSFTTCCGLTQYCCKDQAERGVNTLLLSQTAPDIVTQPSFSPCQISIGNDAQAVFKMVPADAVRLIRTGKSVLEGWHNTYMQVREKIEVSGRDARWEFSKPMLFERTNYMAEICSDLSEMVEIVDDFHKFLGPELKAVTGDSQVRLLAMLANAS